MKECKSLLDIMHMGMRLDMQNYSCSNSCSIVPPTLSSPLTEAVGHNVPS
jgi:hypothetical protein